MNESINLTKLGLITDVNLETRTSNKTQKQYKLITLVLATGGELVVFLKPEQVELLAYMAQYPQDTATKVDVSITPNSTHTNVKK